MKQSLICSLFAFSQKEIKVEEAPRAMSKGTYNAFTVLIPQTTLKEAAKKWEKYFTDGSKEKPVEVNGEVSITANLVPNISPNPLIIYSKMLETVDGLQLAVWFTENDSAFISSQLNVEQGLAAQKFVRDFAVAQYKLAIKKDVEVEEDKLKKLENEQNDLIKSEEKSNKKINDNKRSIQRANDNIRIANEDLKRKDGQISEQKLMVERTAKDENANKGAKKTLKELENEKKQLQKKRDGEDKDIDKWNKEIREEERNIADMKEQQKLKLVEINKQKEAVKAVEQKLNNIK
jgi:hypothetical protein